MTKDILKYDDEGRLHCDDGPAIIYANGDQIWYHYDILHRDDGPAVTYANGYRFWYQHGKLHRDDGPAVIDANGDQYWYLHGKDVTDIMEEWCSARGIDLNNLSEHDKKEIKIYMVSL